MAAPRGWLGDLLGIHDVKNAAGTILPRRSTLKFVGATAADDANAGETLVTIGGKTTVTGITAGTTQTQAGATALTADVNQVATVATTNNGVKLMAAAAGVSQVVINDGANTMKVWPASGDNLGAGVDTAITQAAGTTFEYTAYDATNWRYASMTPAAGSVTSAMLANMAQGTIKGRAAGAGTGVPTDRADAQVLLDMTTVTAGITAGTTQTQAGATALTTTINRVTTAVAYDGVKLRAAVAGDRQIVINDTAVILQVYPATGDDVGEGVNFPTLLAAGQNVEFIASDATTWDYENKAAQGVSLSAFDLLTTGTNYTVPADVYLLEYEMVGGGGGGAGVPSTAAQSACGGGGGEGARTIGTLAVTPGATVTCVIGAGGAGGAAGANNGSNGAATTFNAGAITAPGGAGGKTTAASATATTAGGGAGGVPGTGGVQMLPGMPGGNALTHGIVVGLSGSGGGRGPVGLQFISTDATGGTAATANTGGGGQGAGQMNGGGTQPGGNGGSGYILLRLYKLNVLRAPS